MTMRCVPLACVLSLSAALLMLGLSTTGQVEAQSLPFLDAVPRTSFNCVDRPYGYFADVEANCQVFHICHNNAQWDFLCPNQTMFNQEFFVCDHPVNVDCAASEAFYALNDNFGKVEEDVTEEAPQ